MLYYIFALKTRTLLHLCDKLSSVSLHSTLFLLHLYNGHVLFSTWNCPLIIKGILIFFFTKYSSEYYRIQTNCMEWAGQPYTILLAQVFHYHCWYSQENATKNISSRMSQKKNTLNLLQQVQHFNAFYKNKVIAAYLCVQRTIKHCVEFLVLSWFIVAKPLKYEKNLNKELSFH